METTCNKTGDLHLLRGDAHDEAPWAILENVKEWGFRPFVPPVSECFLVSVYT